MLSIDVFEKGSDVPSPIWELRDSIGGIWQEGRVKIPNFGMDFKLVVMAEQGDNDGKTLKYRVENRILPVEILVYFCIMLQDISMKIGMDDPQILSYYTIKS